MYYCRVVHVLPVLWQGRILAYRFSINFFPYYVLFKCDDTTVIDVLKNVWWQLYTTFLF